ncbi:MAG TPA: hypothetical protein VLJ86_11170 [Ramlibacter sp.]|nr:hypothetical protein [Ramlibacter sp.]
MAHRSTSQGDATHGADMAGASNSAMADFAKQQLASTANATSAVLRVLDVFQQTQQQILQRAAQIHAQTAERVRAANTPTELMAVQSTLLLTGFTELAQCGQQLMMAALKAQSEFMQQPENQPQFGGAANPAAPLLQAWQSAFAATMNDALNGAEAPSRHH